jgi:undecaprenyl-diphosphatase
MAEWLAVLILGLVEGITEFLPISSTGHLLLAEQFLRIRESDTFLVVIQCGAVAAVLLIFQERVRQLLSAWRDAAARDYLLKLVAAFAVTAAGGLVLQKMDFKLPETAPPIATALIVGGVLFIVVERWLKNRLTTAAISWPVAFIVGASQLVAAIFPGTSRSGATILVAMMMGVSRDLAIEFSFLLGVPTLLAAGAVKLLSVLRHPGREVLHWDMLALGTVVSAVTAFLAIRWMLRYLRSHTFEGFGWYRIAVGVVVLLAALL